MVKILIKKGDEVQFLYETSVTINIGKLIKDLVTIYNDRLRINRLCYEVEELSKHGISLPPNMRGLTEEQIYELKLVDEWSAKCEPSGGAIISKDPLGRRNGNAPNDKMKDVLTRTLSDAKKKISKRQVENDVCMTDDIIKEALDELRGAVTIVYPMGIPPHDPVHMEIHGELDYIAGTQYGEEMLDVNNTDLWWAAKNLAAEKVLKDYIGANEKTKIVAKLQKGGGGAPAREPVYSEEERKQMMLHAYKRQEEIKKLVEDDDNSYLNSTWADSSSVKRQLHGVDNISWRPK